MPGAAPTRGGGRGGEVLGTRFVNQSLTSYGVTTWLLRFGVGPEHGQGTR